MNATVCIATYNRYNTLTLTIESICKADLKNITEILIIDQTDSQQQKMPGKLQQLLKEPLITYLHSSTPSLTKARNLGLAQAAKESDIIIYIDDDVEVTYNFFNAHIQAYRNSSIHAAGGREIIAAEDSWNQEMPPQESSRASLKMFINRFFKYPMAFTKKRNRYNKNQVSPGLVVGKFLFVCNSSEAEFPCFLDTVRGCNMSFRVKSLNAIGGFDEGFMGSARREESDVCVRLLDQMGSDSIWYEPEAVLLHHMARSGGCRNVSNLHADHLNNELYYLQKHIKSSFMRAILSLFTRIKVYIRG